MKSLIRSKSMTRALLHKHRIYEKLPNSLLCLFHGSNQSKLCFLTFFEIAIKISRNTNCCNITTTISTEFQLTAPFKNTLQKKNVNLSEIRYFWNGTQLQIEGGDYHRMLEDSVKPLIHVQRLNWLCDISLGGVNKYNKNCSRMITVAGPELCRSTQPFVESYLYIQISEHIELIRQSVRHQFKMLWCVHMFKET